jgi:hypothetical protein
MYALLTSLAPTHSRYLLALLLGGVTAACRSDSPRASPELVASTRMTAEPALAASAAHSTSSAAPPAAEPPPTAMHLFAATDAGRMIAAPAAGGVLIVVAEPFSDNPPAVLVQGNDVTPVRGLFSGLGLQDESLYRGNQVEGFAGRYPDRFHARVSQVGGSSGSETYYYDYAPPRWKQGLGPNPGNMTFVAGKPVAIKAIFIEPLTFGIFGSDATFPDMNPEDTSCPAGRRAFDSPIQLAGTPTGELFMLAYQCGDSTAALVDLWAKGARDSTKTQIPFVAPRSPSIFARSATEAYVAGVDDDGKGYLAVFDGKAWRREKKPLSPVVSMAGADDGTLWLLTEDKVIRRTRDGAMTPLPLPAEVKDLAPEHIVATSGTEAWAFAGGYVVSTRKPKEVLRMDGSALAPRAATADCKDVFVQLYSITKATPPDFDFPKTREALKGHNELAGVRFVVTRDDRFGAVVRSLDEGKAVARLARAGVAGSRPQLLCLKPDEIREVKFDLASGAVKK